MSRPIWDAVKDEDGSYSVVELNSLPGLSVSEQRRSVVSKLNQYQALAVCQEHNTNVLWALRTMDTVRSDVPRVRIAQTGGR